MFNEGAQSSVFKQLSSCPPRTNNSFIFYFLTRSRSKCASVILMSCNAMWCNPSVTLWKCGDAAFALPFADVLDVQVVPYNVLGLIALAEH